MDASTSAIAISAEARPVTCRHLRPWRTHASPSMRTSSPRRRLGSGLTSRNAACVWRGGLAALLVVGVLGILLYVLVARPGTPLTGGVLVAASPTGSPQATATAIPSATATDAPTPIPVADRRPDPDPDPVADARRRPRRRRPTPSPPSPTPTPSRGRPRRQRRGRRRRRRFQPTSPPSPLPTQTPNPSPVVITPPPAPHLLPARAMSPIAPQTEAPGRGAWGRGDWNGVAHDADETISPCARLQEGRTEHVLATTSFARRTQPPALRRDLEVASRVLGRPTGDPDGVAGP